MTLRLTILSLLLGVSALADTNMVMLTTDVAPQVNVPLEQARVITVFYDRDPAVFYHRANGSTNWFQCTNRERVSIMVSCTESNEQFAIGANTLTNYFLITDCLTN